MCTSFTSAQVDQLRRDAQRLRKQEALSHNEALNRIAAAHGYRNWSLLMKGSASPQVTSKVAPAGPVTPPAPPSPKPPLQVEDPRQRYYLHGDRDEGDPNRYYCAQCDVFFEAAHFSTHGAHTGERFLERLERWEKRDARSKATWRRPDNAVNLLQADALADRQEYQAQRQAFSDWLWAQRSQTTRIGLAARGLMTSRGLPRTPKSVSQLVRHYERAGKQYFGPGELYSAWEDFKRSNARLE
jgi:hypothetical protein